MNATISWTNATVTIAAPGGKTEKRNGAVSSVTPHLAVTLIAEPIWGVTHVPTGWAIAMHYQTRAAAMALLVAVAELTDWSADNVAALQSNEVLERALRRIRADIHAREETGDFGPVDHDMIAELNRFSTRLEECQPTRELAMKMRARHARPRKD